MTDTGKIAKHELRDAWLAESQPASQKDPRAMTGKTRAP
jgi:hypothetical protein